MSEIQIQEIAELVKEFKEKLENAISDFPNNFDEIISAGHRGLDEVDYYVEELNS